MSATVAIASGAAASAAASNAAAAAAARRAHEAECRIIMPTFSDMTATIEQRQDYAECVALLYPQEASSGEVLFFKALAFLLFAGIGVGAWLGHRDRFMGAAMGGVLGGLGAPIGGLVLVGLYLAARFLFS